MAITYRQFKQKVLADCRFVPDRDVKEFLDYLAEQLETRKEMLRPEDGVLWRAQKGCDMAPQYYDDTLVDELKQPYGENRMVPDPAKVGSGHANPKGIAYLYLATNPITAIHEVRPWVGGVVSVAAFELSRAVEIVNFYEHSGRPLPDRATKESLKGYYFGNNRSAPTPKTRTPEEIRDSLLYEIDNAFSRPVSLDDEELEYLPTQIIAELVRRKPYDGIAYNSVFSGGRKEAYNLALFDPNAARFVTSCMCKVAEVQIRVGEPSSGWIDECPQGFTDACKPIDDDEAAGTD